MKSAFFGIFPEKINLVYGAEQLNRLKKLTDINSDILVNRDNFDKFDFSELEYIFSTWGMWTPNEQQFSKMPKLKAVFYGAGATDYFARPFLHRNIKVISGWQANAIPVAEFTVSQIVLGLKNFFQLSRGLNMPEKWDKSDAGRGCYRSKIALLGAGSIAENVQFLLKNYDLECIVIPSRKERRTISLEEAFATCDVVSNHLPDRDDNKNILTGAMFASMKPGAVFINTGRGAQVDEEGLIATLKSRPDIIALLDVTSPEPPVAGSELYALSNVFLSPHLAGSVKNETNRMADFVMDDYERLLKGEPLKYEITEKLLMTN